MFNLISNHSESFGRLNFPDLLFQDLPLGIYFKRCLKKRKKKKKTVTKQGDILFPLLGDLLCFLFLGYKNQNKELQHTLE